MTKLKMDRVLVSDPVHELLGKAAALERDAARRYRVIAGMARGRGEDGVSEVAEALATEAEQRALAILAKAAVAGRPAIVPFEDNRPLSPELAERWHDLSTSGHLTPYRLFAHAVAHVATAFAAHAYSASAATSDEAREVGEQLAREELDRAARLRRERRRAFHRDGGQLSLVSLAPHEVDHAVLARFTELARLFQGLAARCREAGDETSAQLLFSLLPGPPMREATSVTVEAGSPEHALRRALRALQATAETLENLAANTSDENVLGSAIRGLQDVVTAIARVSQRLAEVAPASGGSETVSPQGNGGPSSSKSS